MEAGTNSIQNRQKNTATLGLVVHAAGIYTVYIFASHKYTFAPG